jgi:hypothetical protein
MGQLRRLSSENRHLCLGQASEIPDRAPGPAQVAIYVPVEPSRWLRVSGHRDPPR